MVFVTVSVALFMANLDNTIVNVALPSIQRSLDAGISELQWVVAGYTLTFASFMLSGGTGADLFGRRRTLAFGIGVFTAASMACALAPSAGALIACRAVQGIGAACLLPASLAIITHTFTERAERARAIAAWAMVSGVAIAVGPVLGGALVDAGGWQTVFWVNVPVGIATLALARRTLGESSDRAGRSLDLPGQILAIAGLGALTFGFIEAHAEGWGSPAIVGALAAGAAALGVFVLVEARTATPMLDLASFRVPAFRTGMLVVSAVGFALFGIFFFLSLFLQQIQGASALGAGLRLLPLPVCSIVAAAVGGRVAGRRGSHGLVATGMLLSATALFSLLLIRADSSYGSYAWTLVLAGAGIGLTLAPNAAAVMGSVPLARAGMASGTLNMSREAGGNLGVSVLGAVLVARMTNALNGRLAVLPGPARGAVVHAATHGGLAVRVPGLRLATLRHAVAVSYVDGLHLAAVVAAAVVLSGAAVAISAGRRAAKPSVAPAV